MNCEVVTIIVLGAFAIAAFALVQFMKNKIEEIETVHRDRAIKATKEFFHKHQNFNPDEKYINPIWGNGIAVDKKRKLIGLLGQTCHIITAADIIEVNVTEDGQKVIETSRSSQITGAVVGGLLMGGTGAIIGGLSGKQKVSNEVSSVGMTIIWNNLDNPEHHISFFSTNISTKIGKSAPKYNLEYARAKDEATRWHNILKVLMNTAQPNNDDSQNNQSKSRVELCMNCDNKIGRLEQAYLYNQMVVCEGCYNKLMKRT
jgi:hypothetical protein